MNGKRNDLRPAKVFVFGPDVLHFHRLAGEVRGRKLRRKENLFEARAKPAKIRTPRNREAAVHRPFGHGTRTEEVFEIVEYARAESRFHKRRVGALTHLNGTLGQKLLQVRPEIVRNQQSRG